MDKKKTTLITVISILSIFALIILGGLVYYTQISPGENAAYAKEAALKAAAAIMAERQSSMFEKTEPAASPSSPSMRFTAFVIPTIQNTVMRYETPPLNMTLA